MSAALITAALLSLGGLGFTAFLGWTAASGADVWRHVSFGIFSTFLTLLTHSMMMFYLLGKTKAVRDAIGEGGLSPDLVAPLLQHRKPVFSMGTWAMAATMVTAILGASVDTRVLPPIVHAFFAYAAIATNLAALRLELVAVAVGARVVADVNQRLGA